MEKCGYTQCKVIEGGVDAYLKAYPLTQADKVKWKMRPEIGEDLSVLVWRGHQAGGPEVLLAS